MSTLGSIWFVESQGSTELLAVFVGRNNLVLRSLFKATKVLLDEYEIYRRSCFDGVKSGDSFNVGIEGSNGVFISDMHELHRDVSQVFKQSSSLKMC